MPRPAESAPAPVEYGYEQIKNIERAAEQAPSAESGERQKPAPQQSQPAPKPKPKAQPKPIRSEVEPPKVFGYKFSSSLVANPKELYKKGGDPGKAETWVKVLLQRLYKREASKK